MSGASAGYHLMPPLNTNLCPHLRRPVDRSQAEQSYNQFPDTEWPTTRSEDEQNGLESGRGNRYQQ
jgi:hypothetical protein